MCPDFNFVVLFFRYSSRKDEENKQSILSNGTNYDYNHDNTTFIIFKKPYFSNGFFHIFV